MRYFVAFVLPALIFIALIYLVAWRPKRVENVEQPTAVSNTTFVLLLVIGSGFTVALLFGLAQL